MRVPEEPVCIDLFRQNPVFTSLHLKSPVNVVPPLRRRREESSQPALGTGKRETSESLGVELSDPIKEVLRREIQGLKVLPVYR
jgi:hypothetical protein